MNIFNRLFKKKPKDSKITTNMEGEEEKTMVQNQPVDPIEAMSKNIGSMGIKLKTYDIIVFDVDDRGRQTQTPVSGLKASSPQELIALYANCQQRIKILREYDDNPQPQVQMQQADTQNTTSPIVESVDKDVNVDVKERVNNKIDSIISSDPRKKPEQMKFDDSPHYFEVGGIKCKMENGRVYQEQWCKLDSSKYRLISDVNNKEISMNGKHLETLKWVLIEENHVE